MNRCRSSAGISLTNEYNSHGTGLSWKTLLAICTHGWPEAYWYRSHKETFSTVYFSVPFMTRHHLCGSLWVIDGRFWSCSILIKMADRLLAQFWLAEPSHTFDKERPRLAPWDTFLFWTFLSLWYFQSLQKIKFSKDLFGPKSFWKKKDTLAISAPSNNGRFCLPHVEKIFQATWRPVGPCQNFSLDCSKASTDQMNAVRVCLGDLSFRCWTLDQFAHFSHWSASYSPRG